MITDIAQMDWGQIQERLFYCGQIRETNHHKMSKTGSTDAKIIAKVHNRAEELGMSRKIINEIEMEGEQSTHAARRLKYQTRFMGFETYDARIRLYHLVGVDGRTESSMHSIDLIRLRVWPCHDTQPDKYLDPIALFFDVMKSWWMEIKHPLLMKIEDLINAAGFHGCQKCKEISKGGRS